MKSYDEVARDVFRRRDEYEGKKRRRELVFRRVSASTLFAVAMVMMVGTCYVLAAGLGIVDDFLGIFRDRSVDPLSEGQRQYIEEAAAEIGESVTSDGVTVTARGAFSDGTVAFVLLDIEAPEGVDLEASGIGFDVGAREILWGEREGNPNTTGLGITCTPIEDNDGRRNTCSMMIEASCIRLPDSEFSFADGYPRTLVLEGLGAYLEEYPYSRYLISDGCWKFTVNFSENANEEQIELLEEPLRLSIQRMTLVDYVDATIHSIRLKGLGVLFYYTIDEDDIQEAGDFGYVQIVLKDGSIINAYPETAKIIAESVDPGYFEYCCSYIADSPIIFDEADHIVIGGETIIPVPQD